MLFEIQTKFDGVCIEVSWRVEKLNVKIQNVIEIDRQRHLQHKTGPFWFDSLDMKWNALDTPH